MIILHCVGFSWIWQPLSSEDRLSASQWVFRHRMKTRLAIILNSLVLSRHQDEKKTLLKQYVRDQGNAQPFCQDSEFCSDIRTFVPCVHGQHQSFHLWLLMPRLQMTLLTRCSTRLLCWNFSGSVWSRHWLVWDFDGRTSTGSFDEVYCYLFHGHTVCQIATRYQTLCIWFHPPCCLNWFLVCQTVKTCKTLTLPLLFLCACSYLLPTAARFLQKMWIRILGFFSLRYDITILSQFLFFFCFPTQLLLHSDK